jgi:hypothetical protein
MNKLFPEPDNTEQSAAVALLRKAGGLRTWRVRPTLDEVS